jgi:hypothetical protein
VQRKRGDGLFETIGEKLDVEQKQRQQRQHQSNADDGSFETHELFFQCSEGDAGCTDVECAVPPGAAFQGYA